MSEGASSPRAAQSVADAASVTRGVASRPAASRTHVQFKNDFTKTGEIYVHTILSLIPDCVCVWCMLLSCEFMHLWQRACVSGMSQVYDVAVGSTQTSREDPLPEHDLFKRTLTLKIVEHFEKKPQAHGAHVTDQGTRIMEDVILLLV